MHARAIALATVALLSGFLYAQTGSLQTGGLRQTGNALDASPMVGSGGSNSGGTSVGNLQGRLGSNLYITGQSSGLSAFQGSIPYKPADQLQLTLPSASLSNFQRQSVGLKDVLSNSTFAPVPYFDPTKSVVNAGGIASGLNSPGTNVPASTRVDTSSLAGKLYVDATAQYKSLLPTTPGRLLSVPLQSPPPAYVPTVNATTPAALPPGAADEQASTGISAKPGPGVLFGLLRAKDRGTLGEDLAALEQRDRPIDTSIKAEVDPVLLKDPNFNPLVKEPNMLVLGADERIKQGGHAAVPGMINNQDVFLDVLQRLGERREKGKNLRITPGGGKVEEDTTTKPTHHNLVEMSKDNQIVIHSLSGASRDAVNRSLAAAEARLIEGKYYEAVDLYQMVVMYSPQNPLPRMGLALAYFGAGEPISAALEVRKAIEVFPPMMETRLDVGQMMQIKEFNLQMASLERRLSSFKYEKNDPLMLFLACYLDYNAGNADEALRYAKTIQTEVPPEDKLLHAFAKFVITGERPQATSFPSLTETTTAPAE